mgnify:CR=1 FL=1
MIRTETDLHHFFLLDGHVGGERVTYVLDPGGIISHRHVSLSDIAQLLSEHKLSGYGARGEYLLQISPSLLWRLSMPDVAQ